MIENLNNLIKATFNFALNPITIVIIIICIIRYIFKKKQSNNNSKIINDETQGTELDELQNKETSTIKHRITEYNKSYEPKYLMTLNEKAQFRKLQAWAQSRGVIVFSKVRLLDLITPRKGQDNYKGLLWKIQVKHVDFVICDKDIRVKCIIEVNDNSHKRADRSERDQFVTDVLTACGYKVIQTYNVTDEQLDQLCNIRQSTIDEQNQP